MKKQKLIEYPVIFNKKKYRGERGRDKYPRKINVNSLRNLKPFNLSADMNSLDRYVKEEPKKAFSISYIWIGIFILFLILVGIIVWNRYKESTQDSDKLDSDLLGEN